MKDFLAKINKSITGFFLRGPIQSLIKKAVVAISAIILGPHLQPILAPVFSAAGWELSDAAVQAALFAGVEALRMWVSHQPWFKKLPLVVQAAL